MVILTLCVLLYGGVRWYVTTTVSAYRDEEERSGYTPAWAPESRRRGRSSRGTLSTFESTEPPRGWLAARLQAITEHLGKHSKVQRLRRAVAGYEHLAWLHIFLGCFVLVVILAGFVNWVGVLSLTVDLPPP